MIQEAEGKGTRLRTTEITLNCPLMVQVIEDLKNICTRTEYKTYLARYLGEFSCHVRDDEQTSSLEKASSEEEEKNIFGQEQSGGRTLCENQNGMGDEETLKLPVTTKFVLIERKNNNSNNNNHKRSAKKALLELEKDKDSFKRNLRKKRKTLYEETKEEASQKETEFEKREQNIKLMLSDDKGAKLIDALIGLYTKTTQENLQDSRALLSEFITGKKRLLT